MVVIPFESAWSLRISEIADSTQVSLADWLFLNATRGQVIGYDPRLHTAKQIEELSGKLSLKGILLKALPRNPIDVIWNRPAPPMAEAEIFPDTIAGLTSLEKRERVSEAVLGSGARAVVLTLPDLIAWLLNVRGHDVEHNPLVLSNAILHAETAAVDWFVDEQKVPIYCGSIWENAFLFSFPNSLSRSLAN